MTASVCVNDGYVTVVDVVLGNDVAAVGVTCDTADGVCRLCAVYGDVTVVYAILEGEVAKVTYNTADKAGIVVVNRIGEVEITVVDAIIDLSTRARTEVAHDTAGAVGVIGIENRDIATVDAGSDVAAYAVTDNTANVGLAVFLSQVLGEGCGDGTAVDTVGDLCSGLLVGAVQLSDNTACVEGVGADCGLGNGNVAAVGVAFHIGFIVSDLTGNTADVGCDLGQGNGDVRSVVARTHSGAKNRCTSEHAANVGPAAGCKGDVHCALVDEVAALGSGLRASNNAAVVGALGANDVHRDLIGQIGDLFCKVSAKNTAKVACGGCGHGDVHRSRSGGICKCCVLQCVCNQACVEVFSAGCVDVHIKCNGDLVNRGRAKRACSKSRNTARCDCDVLIAACGEGRGLVSRENGIKNLDLKREILNGRIYDLGKQRTAVIVGISLDCIGGGELDAGDNLAVTVENCLIERIVCIGVGDDFGCGIALSYRIGYCNGRGVANGLPLMCGHIDVFGDLEVGLFGLAVESTALKVVCKICKLCSSCDLIRLCLCSFTARKSVSSVVMPPGGGLRCFCRKRYGHKRGEDHDHRQQHREHSVCTFHCVCSFQSFFFVVCKAALADIPVGLIGCGSHAGGFSIRLGENIRRVQKEQIQLRSNVGFFHVFSSFR